MPVGAALGAASIGSAAIGAGAANSAAKTQAQAAQNAAGLQMSMFNTIRGDLAPYRAAGNAALPAVYQLLGLSPGAGGAGVAGGSNGGLTGSYYGQAVPQVGATNWDQVLADNPSLLTEYNRAKAMADAGNPDAMKALSEKGITDPASYAQWWYNTSGKQGGYVAPTWSQDQVSAITSKMGLAGTSPANPDGGGSSISDFLAQTPGYQFQQQQGVQAVNNALSARGLGGLSGSLGKGIARFVTGLADSTYQQQLGNYMNLAGMGQNAAVQTGNAGTTAAGNAGGNIVGAGTAAASGQVGAANAIGGALGGLGNAYLTSRLLGSGMYGGGGGYGTQGTMADPGSYVGADGGAIPY